MSLSQDPFLATCLAVALAAVLPATLSAQEARVDFPADYSTEFTNYLSLDRVQNPDQIMRIFANDVAMRGPGPEGRLEDGSILVAEIHAAETEADGNAVVRSKLGRRIRADMAAIAVMEKRSGWGDAFSEDLRNDDWDFAIFSPEGERIERELDSCRACHAPLDDRDHIFSFEHLPGAR